jgi:hypothetical protein
MTDYLGQITIQLNRAVVPIIIVLGVFGNSINISVLIRPNLYNHACSRYFLALSSYGLIFSCTTLVYRLLIDGYQINPAAHSTATCKILTYITQLGYPMAPYFMVLASIDRFCASSPSHRIRTFSRVNVSRRAIPMVIGFFVVFDMNITLAVDLRPEDGRGCRNRGDTIHKQVYAVTQCVLFAVIGPILITLFGLMTIWNAKRLGNGRVLAIRHRRTERQLFIMLLVQVSSYIVLTLPACIIYPMLVLPTGYRPTRAVSFAWSVVSLPFYLSYASAFPLYVVTASIYRQEFLLLIRELPWFYIGGRVAPAMNLNRPMTISSALAKDRGMTTTH